MKPELIEQKECISKNQCSWFLYGTCVLNNFFEWFDTLYQTCANPAENTALNKLV